MQEQITETRKASNALYKSLKDNGYELPSEDVFYSTLQDSTQASNLYESLESDGFELPSKETFYKTMIDGYGQSQASSTPTQGNHTFTEAQLGEGGDITNKVSQQPQTPAKYGTPEYAQEVINDNLDGENPYRGMTRQQAINTIGEKYRNEWYGKPDAYQNIQRELAAYKIASPEDYGHITAAVRNHYVNSIARQRVESLLSNFKHVNNLTLDDIQGIMDSRETQQAIEEDMKHLGIQSAENAYDESDTEGRMKAREEYKKEKDAYYQTLNKQLQQVLVDKYGYLPASDGRSHAGMFANSLFDGSVDNHEERIRKREALDLMQDYVKGDIDETFAKYDEQAQKTFDETYKRSYYNTGGTPATGTASMYGSEIGKYLYAQQAKETARDYDKIIKDISDRSTSIFEKMTNDEAFLKEAIKKAEALGISPEEYLATYVVPGFMESIQRQFTKTAIAREMPKGKLDYVMRGLEDSVIGMLLTSVIMPKSKIAYRDMANAKYGEDAGMWLEGARMATGMASDFWLWGGWGKIGGAATKSLLNMRIMNIAAVRGISKEAATRMVEEEAKKYLSKRMFNHLMSHIPSSMVTMGGAQATTEFVRGTTRGEDFGDVLLNTAKTGLSSAATGAAFGATGAVSGSLTSKLAGWKRLLGKVAGLEVEAGTLYTTEELQKMMAGEDAFQNPYEGMLEANVKLGFIKASANPMESARKLWNAVTHPVKTAKGMVKPDLGVLDEKDVKHIMESTGGKDLLDALTSMRPQLTKENANREGYLTEEEVVKAADAYKNFMADPDVPWDTKQKVARLHGAIVPPAGYEVSTEIKEGENGESILITRDIDGQCIRELHFYSLEKAFKEQDKVNSQAGMNMTYALQERIDAYDAQKYYGLYLSNEYAKIAEKMQQERISTEDLTDDERQCVYLYQHMTDLETAREKMLNGQELTPNEKQLVDIYQKRFIGYTLEGHGHEVFDRQFERENGLPEGTMNTADLSEDTNLLVIYNTAMEEYLAGKNKAREESTHNDGAPMPEQQRLLDVRSGGEAGGDFTGGNEPPAAPETGETPLPEAGADEAPAAEAAPIVRSERRQAAYDRGVHAINNPSDLTSVTFDSQMASLRMQQLFPESDPILSHLRNDIFKAVADGNNAEVDRLMDANAGYINNRQREAIEQYRDAVEASAGVNDGVRQQLEQYEAQRRSELGQMADAEGNITELALADGSTAYYVSGDLNGQSVMVKNQDGQVVQISTNSITAIGEVRKMEDVLAADVDANTQNILASLAAYANGSNFAVGQQVDFVIAGKPFHGMMEGYDPAGNFIFQMEDGSQVPMTPNDAQQAVMEAMRQKMEAQLRQEKADAIAQLQAERFGKSIVGYNEGTPDLTAKDTDPKAAAEYLMKDSEDGNHAPVLKSIESEINRLNEDKTRNLETVKALTSKGAIEEMTDKEVTALTDARNAIKDAEARRRKWGEIRQELMDENERAKLEGDRQKEIKKGLDAAKKLNQGINISIGEEVPTAEALMERFEDKGDAADYVDKMMAANKAYQRDELFPQLSKVRDTISDYRKGLIDLDENELSVLTRQLVYFENDENYLINKQQELGKLASSLGRLYAQREIANLTPHERKMRQLDKETDREKKLKLAKEAYADDEDALAVLNDTEPQDIYEFISSNIGAGTINWEGIQRGEHYVRGLRDELGKDKTRGIGKDADTFGFNYFLAPEGKGKGVDEVVHNISEGSPYDTEEVRNALLDMLASAGKPTDISHRIIDDRIARAEEIYEENRRRDAQAEEDAKREAEDAAIMEMTDLTPEEYDAFIGDLETRLAVQEGYKTSEEYFNQLAEENDRTNERNAGGSKETGTLGLQGQESEQSSTKGSTEEGAAEPDAISEGLLPEVEDGVSAPKETTIIDINGKPYKIIQSFKWKDGKKCFIVLDTEGNEHYLPLQKEYNIHQGDDVNFGDAEALHRFYNNYKGDKRVDEYISEMGHITNVRKHGEDAWKADTAKRAEDIAKIADESENIEDFKDKLENNGFVNHNGFDVDYLYFFVKYKRGEISRDEFKALFDLSKKAEDVLKEKVANVQDNGNNSVPLQANTRNHGTETGEHNAEQRTEGTGLLEQSAGGAQGSSNGVDISVLTEGLRLEQSGDNTDRPRHQQEAFGNHVIQKAKDNDLYIEPSSWKDFGKRIGGVSGESIVYIDEANNRVVKVKDPFAKAPMKGHSANDAIYEHIVHNLLFPNSRYELIGISESNGDVRFVLAQELLKDGYQPATQEQIDNYLINELGLKKENNYYYGNDYYSITDVGASGDNVLVGTDGELHFIDPIIKFKKPAVEVLKHLGYDRTKEAAGRAAQAGETLEEANQKGLEANRAGGRVKSNIQGLEDYSEDEIKKYVREFVQEQVEEADADAEIVDIAIIGSRTTGTAKPDSDLDVLLEYKGKNREDDLFNLLADADEPLVINGIKVDINPITEEKSGTIAEFLERNKDYKKEEPSKSDLTKGEDLMDTPFADRLKAAKGETNTNPTEEQKKAGNYKMGHIRFGGYRMSIENPKGSTRSGVDTNGKPWSIKMQDTYGYIGEKYGADGDHLDFFINDDADLDNWNGRVYIIDQKNEDGTFDEHKVMYGYATLKDAKDAYLRNYEDGWWDKHVMGIMGVKKADFDKWLNDSDHKRKPFADYFRTKHADTIKDNVDQLLADVAERKAKAEKQTEPSYTETQLAKMSKSELTSLRNQRQKDFKMNRYLLKAAGVAGSGSAKEMQIRDNMAQANADMEAIDAELERKEANDKARLELPEFDFMIGDVAREDETNDGEKRDENIFPFGKNVVSLQSELGREAVDGQKATLPKTAPWREGVEEVTIHTTLNAIRKKYGELHEKAKAGDIEAAVELVLAVAKPEKVKAIAQQHPNAKVAYVHAEEQTGRNQIPAQYAGLFEDEGLEVSDIVQTNKPSHTGSDRVGRFVRRARFDGEVEPEAEYIIVDDHVTMGGTLRDLKDYIESKGGKVVAVTTLTASAGGTKLRPTDEQIQQLKDKGITNDQLKELGIADSIDGLTRREAAEILVLADKGGDSGSSRGRKAVVGIGTPVEKEAPADSIGDKSVEASIVSLRRSDDTGLNLNDPLGRKLSRLKKEAGPNGLVGYTDSKTGDYVILGNDADIVRSIAGNKFTVYGEQDGMQMLRIPSDKLDIVSPKVIREGYKMAFTTDEVDATDKLLDEVERRKEVASQKESEKRVKEYLDKHVKGQDAEVRKRATKAVLKAMDKAGVPYKVVSKDEERQMMQIFSMMNQESVKAFCRRVDIRSTSRHGFGRYCVYNMADPFAVPMYHEKLSYAKEDLEQLKRMVPKGAWEILDIGYADEAQDDKNLTGKAADMDLAELQADIETWHGSGAVFTRFDHSHIGEGAMSQVFGWGTYLSSDRKVAEGYTQLPGDIRYSHLGEEISKKDTVMMMAAEIMTDPTIKNSRDAEKFANRFRDKVVPGNEERLKLWDKVIEVLRNSQKSDFKTNERTPTLYKVDIPDDNGENYLDYKKPVGEELAKKIRDFVYDHVMTSENKGVYEGMDANVIREDIDRVLEPESNMAWMQRALETRGVTPKEFSQWLSKQGYVGIKYPAGTIMGGGNGATNYVIFNEDDAKITDTIQFMMGDEPAGNLTGSQVNVGEKEVGNVIVDSTKKELPHTKEEALAAIPDGGKLYDNNDQQKKVRVGKKSLRHSSLHDNADVYKAYGMIGELVKNAVKIGEEPVSSDEEGHTHSVSIFYVPANVDGTQYSVRMVVKEYENKGLVLDELSLYNVSMHKEKTPSHTNLSTSKEGGVQYDGVPSGYKVKELIHSTQENDQKLLGISENDTSFQKEGKKIMGWSDGKQVYLTEAGLNPNTPLHETTHLWDKWCQKEKPELWKKVVDAMKKTAMWEEISKNPNYRNIWNDDNRMASEVHARLSGAKGEDEFMKAAFKKDTPQSIIDEVKSVLRKFWESILRLFGKATKTIGDEWSSLDAIIRMPLKDLLNQDFEKVMRVAEGESDAQVEGHIVEDKDDVKLQKAPEDAEAPSDFDVAVRDRLINDFLKPAGIEVSTDIAEGEANGNGDMKLSKRNQIYTDNFKKFFGDWERAAKKVKVSDPGDIEFTNNSEFLKFAKQHFTETVDGKEVWKSYINKDSGNEIGLSSNGINKSISNKAISQSIVSRKQHLKALSKLDEILEESLLGETHADRNNDPNILEIQRYYGAVILDGKIYRVKTTVKKVKENKGKTSNKHYSFEVQEIELIEKRPVSQEIRGSETANTSDISNNSITAANLLNKVESSKNKGEKIFDVSKVVDKEGKPLVVYHDTNSTIYINKETGENWDDLDWKAKDEWSDRDDWDEYWKEQDFWAFDNTNHGRTSIEVPGFFFAPKEDPYHEYGKRTIKAYLNIKNPIIDPVIPNRGVTNSAGRDAMEEWIRQGYDGMIRTNEDGSVDEYVAFFPNQIKSADQNIGTFDTDNPDIRYLKTSNGEAYGYVKNGKIFIDPRIAKADTPIHEYNHLWAEALRKVNPEEWKNVVKLMKGVKDIWDAVKRDYSELKSEDDIAEEVLTTYSGKRGRERFYQEKARVEADQSISGDEKVRLFQIFDNVKKALHVIWNRIADFLHIHYVSAEQVADQVLGDLLSGVDPRKEAKKYATESGRIKANAEREGNFMMAPDGTHTKLSEKEWVAARTADFKKWLGFDWEHIDNGHMVDETQKAKLDKNGEPLEKYVQGYMERPRKPGKPKKKESETMAEYFNRLRLWEQAIKDWPETEAQWKAIVYRHDGSALPDETAIHEKWMQKYEEDLAKWKVDNALPADAEAPVEKPVGDDADPLEYMRTMADWRRREALWKTAPDKQDYEREAEAEVYSMLAALELRHHPISYSARMKQAGASLSQLRNAILTQKRYDQTTVQSVVDFAKNFMSMGFGDNIGRGDLESILTSVKRAVGARSIKDSVDAIMNKLVENHLRNLSNYLEKLTSIKDKRLNPTGVEVQGELDLEGQRAISEFRRVRAARMTPQDINTRLDELASKIMDDPENRSQWEAEYDGAHAALTYMEGVAANKKACADAENDIKDAEREYKNSGRSYAAQQELLESLHKGLTDLLFERIDLYGQLFGELGGLLGDSRERAHEFREREKLRVFNIHRMAAIDMAGKDANEVHQETLGRALNNSALVRLPLSSLGTFEQLLKQFGSRNPNGEGRLYNHYMRGFIDATNKEQEGLEAAKSMLDAKASEVFGRKMQWSTLYRLERSMPTLHVIWRDGEGNLHPYTLSQGNMLAIYMWNKMHDGQMKLRKMDITDSDVERIKEHIDPKLITLADWVQEDFLPTLRTKYNKVHEEEFGAAMAEIENYFPLRIVKDSIQREEDLTANPNMDSVLPSTTTGSIIKRTVNAKPLDILNTDALSLIIEHIEEMEKWAAFTHWNKDVNTLLSYNRFKNQVKNMDTIYGSGDELWDTFRAACQMAAGTYRATHVKADKAMTVIAAGVTGAKIAFRPYTALKQLLSAPAFLSDASVKNYAKYFANPKNFFYENFKWGMENLPVLRKRWHSRDMGDTRLSDKTGFGYWHTQTRKWVAQYGMWANGMIDVLTCAAGARSVYETRLVNYKKLGYDEAEAKKKALQDASIAYNLTQQSSEGAFVSQIQKDRTLFANMWTVFRNSPMAYTRQSVDAIRNLKRLYSNREDMLYSLEGQFKEDGFNESQAKRNARAEYKRAIWKNMAKLAVCAFVLPWFWELGSKVPYLIFGDDDELKKRMLGDVTRKELLSGPTEGLTFGSATSTLIGAATDHEVMEDPTAENVIKAVSKSDVQPLPMFSDMATMFEKFGYDKAAGLQDLVNIACQIGTGVNPKTLTDPIEASIDACRGDMTNAKEIELFLMRVVMVPNESAQNIYLDEIGMDAKSAKSLSYDELAERYADYQFGKNTPMFGWVYSDEAEKKRRESYLKRFDKEMQDRVHLKDNKALKLQYENSKSQKERKMIGKEAAARQDSDDFYTKHQGNTEESKKARNYYINNRSWSDLMEDLELERINREAKANGNKDALDAIRDARKDLSDLIKELSTEKEGWQQLRDRRKEVLNELMKKK